MSSTAHTHRGLAAIVAVMAMLWLAGCGSSGKTPSADAPAGNETPAASNAAGNGNSKSTEPKIKATRHQEVLAARQAVITMTKCVEEHGVKVPPQKLYAATPVFDLKGIDTKTPQFHAAYNACLPKAVGVYKGELRKGV